MYKDPKFYAVVAVTAAVSIAVLEALGVMYKIRSWVGATLPTVV